MKRNLETKQEKAWTSKVACLSFNFAKKKDSVTADLARFLKSLVSEVSWIIIRMFTKLTVIYVWKLFMGIYKRLFYGYFVTYMIVFQ